MTISIPISIVLFLLGIAAFIVPFRNGIITDRFKAIIDNSIFRLHYRLTFGFLFAFSIFLSATTLIEEPMDQINDGDRVWKMLESSCMLSSEYNLSDIGLGNAYERSMGLNETILEREPSMMYFYQVVTLSLFVQGVLFLLPYRLWRALESGITQKMLDIYNSTLKNVEKGMVTGREGLVNRLAKIFNTIPDGWFYSLIIAEVLNFINVVGQIFFINSLFNGHFMGQNIPWYRSNLSNWEVECNHAVHLPMSGLKTKCFFEREVTPGDMRHIDAVCKFPRTSMDEKFYMFMTFWLLYIAALSASVLICRFFIVFSPRVRKFWTRSRVRLTYPECYEFIFRKSTLADWFLFDMLCKNFEPDEFNDLINDFAKKLEGKKFRKPVDNYI
ncbi:innexin inx2-like [Argiope bruennichi]|uniref:Innexin n=1 Tax=Argiope bruennichi TaxID=94029 RepID=A0A8T0EHK5_ARGBR|nr:innexin inx2-like [Argiope bruennichi]XP_055951096.1 innexin inx2-like [Argiope bruennichi]XP_055951097.1 innexin inx2-like [Argiope bruennichi]XP_055951098.1 innexin inx2-like [Argiope bruennichi]KAF8773078.1 Innexin inx2 like protein [Argiope bruennichi]